MSCGQIALERAGIHVDNYYSSEIDKYAIQITQKNYPNTIQLGDITKWSEWDLPEIDLILAGSPCQGFSTAGKQLAFNDPRSRLFFDFVDIKNHYGPKNFLLENVNMKQEYQNAISDLLGLFPRKVNSSLLSAQNRVRLYWFNFPFTWPENAGILLKDIIEKGVVDRDKSYCVDANYWKGGNLKSYFEKHRRQLVFQPISTRENGRRLTTDGKKRDDKNGLVVRGYEVRPDGKTCALSTVQKDNYVTEDYVIRKLTPVECERLQTVPDNYTEGVSNTQRYKMLGNDWTVDVIVHILRGIARKRIQGAKDSMGLFK